MTLQMSVELQIPNLAAELERERHELTANVAHVVERRIRRRDTLWPQDTGFSRDRFRLEDDSATGDILVLNTAPYARHVNDRRAYPSGRRNPNYRAAQRAIEAVWAEAVRKVRGAG